MGEISGEWKVLHLLHGGRKACKRIRSQRIGVDYGDSTDQFLVIEIRVVLPLVIISDGTNERLYGIKGGCPLEWDCLDTLTIMVNIS